MSAEPVLVLESLGTYVSKPNVYKFPMGLYEMISSTDLLDEVTWHVAMTNTGLKFNSKRPKYD